MSARKIGQPFGMRRSFYLDSIKKWHDAHKRLPTPVLEHHYDVTVKFSPTLKVTFRQITAKQQNIKLELASLSKARSLRLRQVDDYKSLYAMHLLQAFLQKLF